MAEEITVEKLMDTVPKHAKRFITEEVVALLNRLQSEEGEAFAEAYKQNFISHTRVLNTGEFTMKDYINAVKFVSYRLLQHPDIDAYMLTFPDRYAKLMERWRAEGLEDGDIRANKISPYVSMYKKNALVVKITEQALVAPHVLNAPMFQQALNIQMEIAMTARSEQVRSMAAESVMKYTKAPEVAKIEMDVAIKGGDEVAALRDEMARLAELQLKQIESKNMTSKDVAHSKLLPEPIDAEIDDE